MQFVFNLDLLIVKMFFQVLQLAQHFAIGRLGRLFTFGFK
jgi:hypothetical protein